MKRSPLVRKSPLRRKDGPAHEQGEHPRAKEAKTPKDRVCICGASFTPKRMEHVVCSPRCLSRHKAAKAKAERENLKARKEAIKTIPQLIADADKAFADYIRTRDRLAGYDCISSGRPLDWSGNQVDAGHYRSRGAASHLRYHEDNAHAQSKHDNQFKAGNVVEYRIRLIQRIGVERVEALETNNEPHKWTRDELTAIKNEYRAKRKELEKEKE